VSRILNTENSGVTNPVSVINAAAAVTTTIPNDDDDDNNNNNNKSETFESFPFKLTSENYINNGVMRATVSPITSITPNCYLAVKSKW